MQSEQTVSQIVSELFQIIIVQLVIVRWNMVADDVDELHHIQHWQIDHIDELDEMRINLDERELDENDDVDIVP